MNTEPTLGDILAQAFAEAERSLLLEEEKLSADCTVQAAQALAKSMAAQCGVTYRDAWDELCHVPDDMLRALSTAPGWTVLADHIVREIGMVNVPLFIPTIH